MNYGTQNKARINEVLAYMGQHSDEFDIRVPSRCVMGMIFRAAHEYRWKDSSSLVMSSLCLLGIPLNTYDHINNDIIMPDGWLKDDAATVYTYERAVRMLERYRDHGWLSWEGV